MAGDKKVTMIGIAAVVIIAGSVMTAVGELDPILPATHEWVREQIAQASDKENQQYGNIQTKLDKMLSQMHSVQNDVLTSDLRYVNGQIRLIDERLQKTPNDQLLLQQRDDLARQAQQLEKKLSKGNEQ